MDWQICYAKQSIKTSAYNAAIYMQQYQDIIQKLLICQCSDTMLLALHALHIICAFWCAGVLPRNPTDATPTGLSNIN